MKDEGRRINGPHPQPLSRSWARRMRRLRDRGAALVETAMILFLVLLLIAGMVDLGRAFSEYIVIGEASRAGARYGSLNPSDEGGIRAAAVQMAANNGVAVAEGDISIVGLGGQPGDPIRVTVTHQFPTLMGSIIGFETITMTCATEMVIVGQ
jgi:Flp pilus assembly protein TadG